MKRGGNPVLETRVETRDRIAADEDYGRVFFDLAEVRHQVLLMTTFMKISADRLVVAGQSTLDCRATCFGIVDVNDTVLWEIKAELAVHGSTVPSE